MFATLKTLCRPDGVSGAEKNVRDVIRAVMEPLCDEITVDSLGNLLCVCRGHAETPKNVMLCAHMDEIGFLVTYVEENGTVRVAPVGGVPLSSALYTVLVSENGTEGTLVPHADVTPANVRAGTCYVDIGATSRAAAERSVKIGDRFRYRPELKKLSGTRVIGHPLDDRIGCAVLVSIAENLPKDNPDTVTFVFSVQEEVGCRGAGPAAYAVRPDLCLVYDVTGTGDTEGSDPMAVSVGKGAAIKVKDGSVLCDPQTVDALEAVAKEKKIPVQKEILLYGGTDTSVIQMAGTGCRAGAISIPTRYIHTPTELIDLRDAEAAVTLTLAYLRGGVR